MFVVRLKRPHEDFDLKALRWRKRAFARFRTAQKEMIDGDVEECALFDAATRNAERALEMVRHGEARLIASNLADGPPQASGSRRAAP